MKQQLNIYLIAICGTAMASLASMLKSIGHNVYGSDENVYPPMSTFLEEQGINILKGFSADNLIPKPDLVVIGNAMSRGNPEVEYVLENKITYKSLPVILKEFFIQGKKSFVVTGTHGKTTTSSLLSWLIAANGENPGFLIGGIPENFVQGSRVGNGQYFVVEGDEYDTAFFDKGPKFLHYLPDVVIINNLEFDHADIYNSLDDIKINFRRLVNIIPGNGLLIVNNDDEDVMDVVSKAFCPVVSYGFSENATYQIKNIVSDESGTNFLLYNNGSFFSEFQIPLFGEHNVQNATAVIIAGLWLKYSTEKIQNALSKFKGVRRRLQLKAEINSISIFDDFAHHPTEIKETIKGMKKRFPNRRLWAVYEPRSATAKRNLFFEKYVEAFKEADQIILGPIHRPDKAPENSLLDIELLVKKLNDNSKNAIHVNEVPKIVSYLSQNLKPKDLILVMSNGSFDNIHEKLIQSLG